MRGRRVIERQREGALRINNFVDAVDCPGLSDVVFKTGTSSLSHPGNSLFHEMLRNRPDDSQISSDAVGMIFEHVTKKKWEVS
jgi:hypothetical protein